VAHEKDLIDDEGNPDHSIEIGQVHKQAMHSRGEVDSGNRKSKMALMGCSWREMQSWLNENHTVGKWGG